MTLNCLSKERKGYRKQECEETFIRQMTIQRDSAVCCLPHDQYSTGSFCRKLEDNQPRSLWSSEFFDLVVQSHWRTFGPSSVFFPSLSIILSVRQKLCSSIQNYIIPCRCTLIEREMERWREGEGRERWLTRNSFDFKKRHAQLYGIIDY